jgi:sulfhydrogenase subunit alpha
MSHDLTRIEGNARIIVERKKGEIIPKINIYESSRKFEKILIGKNCFEVPEIVSRICGICHVPHKLAGIMAIENALNVKVSRQTELLRELLTLGSTMDSHILHLLFMVFPDMEGYDNIFEMMNKYKSFINIGLEIDRVSKEIIKTIGGRDVHTLTPIVGGFARVPNKNELKALLKKLKEIRKNALAFIKEFSKYKKDLKFKRKTKYLSLKGNKKYELVSGDVISSDGFIFKPQEYRKYIKEYSVNYSTSKFSTFKGESYMVGALARLVNNGTYLKQKIRKFTKEIVESPFSNNFAQAIEIYYCIERAIEIIKNLNLREEKTEFKYKDGEGVSITEAPRGILIHHYKIKNGKIRYVNIITPTSQNLRNIEESAKEFLEHFRKKKDIEYFLERLVRAYDPCISCATHLLEVEFR